MITEQYFDLMGRLVLFKNLTYSGWTSSLPSYLWSLRIFPSLPGSRLTSFLSRCKFSNLTAHQPMVEFYLLTFPRFPLRKKEHKSYCGKNRTHYFRTSRCAAYLLDYSGDERSMGCRNRGIIAVFKRRADVRKRYTAMVPRHKGVHMNTP